MLLQLGNESREHLLTGATAVVDAVKFTLGPKGSTAIFNQDGNLVITKNGIAIVNQITFEDPVCNMGAELLKQVAAKTNIMVNDGTTTAMLIAYKIIKDSYVRIADNANAIDIKRGIDIATSAILIELDTLSRSCSSQTEIKQVAITSANGDSEIGEIIADALQKVSKETVISVEGSNNLKTSVEMFTDQDNINIIAGRYVMQFKGNLLESEKTKLYECLKMAGNALIIKIGGATGVEIREKTERAEKALVATWAAINGGIVPGGGVALIRARNVINVKGLNSDQYAGISILLKAVEEPLRYIISNAKPVNKTLVQKLLHSTDDAIGYDVLTSEYVDMFEQGIVDPTDIVKTALINAVSIAGMAITSNCTIC